MAPFPIGTFVETFLDHEKEGARQLIRHEMESMIDPLVESLFGQLKDKFVDYCEASSSISHQEPSYEHDYEGDAQIYEPSMIRDQQTIVNAQQSLENTTQVNSSNHQLALNSIKEEINDPSMNVQFEPQLNDHSISSSSSAQESTLIQSTSTLSTDASLANTEMQQQPQHQSFIKHNQFDDEDECDCDECVNDGIEEIKHEDEEDEDDSVQWVEESQEDGESSPPVKRPKMDTTQNEINAQTEVTMVNCRQSPRQPTDEEQVNNQDKLFITVSLRCPESECLDSFPENELNDHLKDEHSIGPNRCLVKDCKQSFDNCHILGEHIKQVHQGTTQWHCDKCDKHFPTYRHLSHHNYHYHQLGHFQCSFPSCTFTGEYKNKMFSHYATQHKSTFNCQHPGCNFQTPNPSNLKTHQRTHTGIKPYRCKWSQCDFASARQSDTIRHIRLVHLAPKPGSVPNGAQLDPKDYVEVMHDLL